jgi:hypothetical protein
MPPVNVFRDHVELIEVGSRVVVTVVALTQGLMAVAIDCNRTHATNPQWPAHARFHVVWQVGTSVLFGLVEAALIWWRGSLGPERFYLAAALTGFPMLAFVTALIFRATYGSALHDINGIAPARIKFHRRVWWSRSFLHGHGVEDRLKRRFAQCSTLECLSLGHRDRSEASGGKLTIGKLQPAPTLVL